MRETGPGELRAALRRHRRVLWFFGLAHILIFMILFEEMGQTTYSSTGIYFDYASKMTAGQIPYRDFAVEYPPLSLLFFLLPRLAASTPEGYAIAFAVQTLLFSLLGLFVIVLVSPRLGLPPWKSAVAYTVCLLAIGPIISRRYDIFPAVLVILALYAFLSEKHRCTWVLLAAGAMTKVYPAALLPVFLLYHCRNHPRRCILPAVLTFVAASFVIALPFLLVSPTGLLGSLTYHAERGIQLESTYGSLLLVLHKFGLLSLEPSFAFGSWNLTGTAADALTRMSMLLLPLSVAAMYWMVHRHLKSGAHSAQELVSWLLLVTIMLVATSKVLSPEYLIWFLPLIPLVSGRLNHWVWVVFIAISVLTYTVYPLQYRDLIMLESGPVVVLLLRNVLLVLMAAVIAVSELYTSPNGVTRTP